jgi:hypothetical protein
MDGCDDLPLIPRLRIKTGTLGGTISPYNGVDVLSSISSPRSRSGGGVLLDLEAEAGEVDVHGAGAHIDPADSGLAIR